MKVVKLFLVFLLLTVTLSPLRGSQSYSDGPYIFWESENPAAFYVYPQHVKADTIFQSEDGNYYLQLFDSGNIKLQKEFPPYQTAYALPEKFLVISDMHGNWNGTVNLLTAAGVMDENFKWVYDGWLIVDGDILDRGEETTMLMWLLYHLWQQAENTENGKVILLLGNHETMTLSTRTHKVSGKYAQSCQLMEKTYNELYGESSILGKWMRSWQSILVLGPYLVVHGGISPSFAERYNDLDLVNHKINTFYQNSNFNEDEMDYLFTRNGPFWYRGYFSDDAKWEYIDKDILLNILRKYGLQKIIVGHTTFSDIHTTLDKLVIAVDAGLKYQEEGEALLYENNKFYRMDHTGKTYNITK